MYTISVINYTGEYTLHNPYDDKIKVIDPVLSLELNKSGILTFTISPENPNREQIRPLASEIYVYRNGALFWVGRPISMEENFNLLHEVTCEGVLGYLLDTQVPPFDFTGNNSIKGQECIKTFLTRLVNRHNAELSTSWEDSRKRFTVGSVTIYDSNNNLARSSEDYKTTLETINEKLLETHGGYLRVRYQGATRYIDYIDTFGNAKQPISFGDNLLDLTAHVNTDEIATNVIPIGAENSTTGKRLTLAGYNPTTAVKNQIAELTHGGAIRTVGTNSSFAGFTGIYDKAAEDSKGRVYVVQTWDDVQYPSNLALKAAEYIGAISVLGKTIDVSAVDLAQIDVDYNTFNLGEMATVVSIPHDINAEYQITQMSIDLYNPANSKLTLGGELRTFTFDNTKKQAEIVTELETGITSAVQNATALLSGGLGGYLIIRQDEGGQPYEILIMNQATEEAATNCVRINKNGLGFGKKASGQSAASWVYRNAWTIDGNLIADFITTGTLNANRIKAGVLSDTKGNTSLNLSTGVFTMKKGSISLGNGKFKVDDTGYMSAVDGDIGAWYINGTGLYSDFVANNKWGSTSIKSPKTLGGYIMVSEYNGKNTFYVTARGRFYLSPVNSNGQWGSTYVEVDTSNVILQSKKITLDANDTVVMYGDSLEIYIPNVVLAQIPNTTAHSGNVWMNSASRLYYANEGASSRKIKHDIKPVENEELKPERLYDAEVIQYKYNEDFLSDDDPNRGVDLIGFVVEDLHEVYPCAVSDEEEDSKHWTWSPYRIIPPMLKLIQDQKRQIDYLEARISKLETLIMKGE